jgi:hypothetical protein
VAAHRTGEFTLRAADAAGREVPIRGANLTLVRHAFAFGAAIAPEVVRDFYGDDVFSRYMEVLAENFWSITPENAFKWWAGCIGGPVGLGPGL